MVRAPGELVASPRLLASPKLLVARQKLLACLAVLLVSAGLSTPLAAQDQSQNNAGNSPCAERPAGSSSELPAASAGRSGASRPIQPGQTAADADSAPDASSAPKATPDPSAASPADPSQTSQGPASQAHPSQPDCAAPAALPEVSRYFAPLDFSSSALADSLFPQDVDASSLTKPHKQYPVSPRTGKWGGEEWRPAILQTLGFTLAQNGYRLATEQKTRSALVKETWHSYWLAVSGLHTWSDGGKTWTVYIAHPAQGAVFNDIWTEHDPHGVLVPFGFNHAYWGSRIKAFWWDSLWELQWKFGPFSEASIGNVGLKPGKLGANTIVSSAFIGTGLAVLEDMGDRYAIAKWEKKTDSVALRAVLRSTLNPDRSFANLFRKKYPWYRDTRPTLRSLEP